MSEIQVIGNIIANKVKMLPLTPYQQITYDETESCVNRGQLFTANK